MALNCRASPTEKKLAQETKNWRILWDWKRKQAGALPTGNRESSPVRDQDKNSYGSSKKETTMAQPMPYAVEVSPDSALQFTITRDPSPNAEGDGASRCVMTIRHPGLTKLHLAFKVRNPLPSPGYYPPNIIKSIWRRLHVNHRLMLSTKKNNYDATNPQDVSNK